MTKSGPKMGKPKLTGGPSDYYLVDVKEPCRSSLPPYIAECEDIIEALDLNWAEANVFKSIWRIARERQGKGKEGNPPTYDAEKLLFFAKRVAVAFEISDDKILKVLGYGK